MCQPVGTVYLIHFLRPLKHAQHYIGFSEDFRARLQAHGRGRGARLMEVVTLAGIDWRCVRTWQGCSRADERALKRRKDARSLCPCCAKRRRAAKRAAAKARRAARRGGCRP